VKTGLVLTSCVSGSHGRFGEVIESFLALTVTLKGVIENSLTERNPISITYDSYKARLGSSHQ
jgi:hypothetical protein